MAQRKNINEQIEKAKEDIRQHEAQLKTLQKKQTEQERKARTNRLCRRGGFIESKLPEVITLTDEDCYSFLEKTLFTDQARRILAGLIERNATTITPKPTGENGGNGETAGV